MYTGAYVQSGMFDARLAEGRQGSLCGAEVGKMIHKPVINTFDEAVEYINSTPRFTKKSTMEQTKAFLHLLGDPDRSLRIIHVAGTNGKGSVCAYMSGILRAAGFKVALFTSPHLVDIRERFTVDGEMISRERFLGAFRYILDLVFLSEKSVQEVPEQTGQAQEVPEQPGLKTGPLEQPAGGGFYHPTYFEFLFFIAMLYFGEEKPDYCILETGLGGRLDATNSVSQKELAVVTRIGLDHVEYLGDTLEKIAGEKAGIMREGAPAVYWDTCSETTAVFEKRAAELGISAVSVSKNDVSFLKFNRKNIDFSFRSSYYNNVSLTLNTIAAYQTENAALAVRAAELLDAGAVNGGKGITVENIKKGISGCFWAGRMEEVLPGVFVDGAHNEDGIRAFLETVAMDGHEGARTLLFAVVRDKDYESMVEEVVQSGLFHKIVVTGMSTGRDAGPEVLGPLFGRYPGSRPEGYESVAAAVEGLLRDRGAGERIYAAGSLYLVGEIKEFIEHDKFRGRIKEISSQP